jgi:hypothetical protein
MMITPERIRRRRSSSSGAAGATREPLDAYVSSGISVIPEAIAGDAAGSVLFYSIRSESQLMDRLEFDLLFRWFASPKRTRAL